MNSAILSDFENRLRLTRSAATAKLYAGVVRRVSAIVDPLTVERAELETLMLKGGAPSTVRLNIHAMKCFCEWLCDHGLRGDNPMAKCPLPKLGQRLPKFLKWADVVKMLDKTQHKNDLTGFTFNPLRDRAIIMTFALTGARLAEVCDMTREDVSGDRIRIVGKGNKERVVPIHDRLRKALAEYLASRHDDDPSLFCVGRGTIGAMVNNVGRYALGRSDVTPHMLRHTFASLLAAQHVDVLVIQKLLGHANLNTTQIYCHVQDDALGKAVNTL